jgi:hypothetical protein
VRGSESQFAGAFSQNVGYLCLVPPEGMFNRPRYVSINNLYVFHIAVMVIL